MLDKLCWEKSKTTKEESSSNYLENMDALASSTKSLVMIPKMSDTLITV